MPNGLSTTLSAGFALLPLTATIGGILRAVRRDATLECIASGGGGEPSGSGTERELRRLRNASTRKRVADSFVAGLHAAEYWDELAVATRPPPSVKRLRPLAGTIEEVAALLRAEGAPPRGVALAERISRGGYGSPLYVWEVEELPRELGRARFRLQTA